VYYQTKISFRLEVAQCAFRKCLQFEWLFRACI